jgi:flagellar basal-body rod modification protein FlgD
MISEIASRATVQIGQQQFSNTLSDSDRLRVQESVRSSNLENQVQYGREMKQVMDKDDFLKILITQLQNQDPTAPMEDREFIAQMAQFSSLEQMTNLSQNFERLSAMLTSGNALNVLGKEVDLIVNGDMITGQVSEVTRGDFPQVLVNGRYFDFSDIQRVREL